MNEEKKQDPHPGAAAADMSRLTSFFGLLMAIDKRLAGEGIKGGSMKVSKVEVVAVRPNQGLVGFASVELDGQILLNSIGIHSRLDGLGYRLTYPTRSGAGTAVTVFHPTTPDLSKEIEAKVFERAHQIFDL